MRNQPNPIEIASLAIPVIACFFRIAWGVTILRSYNSAWRFFPFFVGLVLLALGECIYILMKDNPDVPQDQNQVIVFSLAVWGVYLVFMAIAFFPTKLPRR